MKQLFAILLLCMYAGAAFGQGDVRTRGAGGDQAAPTAQTRRITGRVLDSSGQPLLGATVSVVDRATNKVLSGTYTDVNGNFAVDADPTANVVVRISYVGYANQEVAVTAATSSINVSLQDETSSLDEVVVTALGVEKRKGELAYSVTQLKGDAVSDIRQTNVSNALTAKVAGLRVSGSNGMVGSSAAIFIRGFTTFTGSNQPLFVIDGIPIDNGGGGNALQTGVSNSNRGIDLNPDEIEKVNVLKGPAAAILYGSRAVSGAIEITTKKGAAKKGIGVDITTSFQAVEPSRLPKYQNEYAQGAAGFFNPINDFSWGPRIAGQAVTDFRGLPSTLQAYPDNVRDIFRTGNQFSTTVGISGGGEKGNYRFSYGNTREIGFLDGNDLSRHNFGVNGNYFFTSKLTVGINVQYINNVSRRSQQGNQLSNPFFRSWFTPRSYDLSGIPFEDAAGNQVFYGTADNPYWSLKYILYDDRVNRVIANTTITYTFNDWIRAQWRVGTDAFFEQNEYLDPLGRRGQANTASPLTVGAMMQDDNFSQRNNSFLSVFFTPKINDDITLDILVGNEVLDQRTRFRRVIGQGLVVPGLRDINNTTTFVPTDAESQQRLIGLYGEANFNYKKWGTISLAGRFDWSSTLPKDNRVFFYPRVGASIDVMNIVPDIKNKILSGLTIRGNWTKVGRAPGVYLFNDVYGQANPGDGFGPNITFPVAGQAGFSLGNAAGNPNIGPEFTTSREIGAEFKFWESRIRFDVNYFRTNTTDIILAVPAPATTGFTSQIRNAGEMETSGWELELSATPVQTRNFTWTIDANWTTIKNTVVSLAEGVPNIFLGGFVTPQGRLAAGEPYGLLFGADVRRHTDGRPLLGPTGLPSFAPTNVPIGDPNPDWTAGVGNTLRYKGFSLYFLFDLRRGGDIVSRNILDMRRSGAAEETGDRQRTYVIEGWRADANGNVILGGDGQPIANGVQLTSEAYWGNVFLFGGGRALVFDGSWIRLRELSIAYAFPQTITDKLKLNRLELSVFGRNLWLWAPNFPHFDPETNALGQSNTQGLEFNALPQARTYGFLLKVSF